jgi:hypothetical protein
MHLKTQIIVMVHGPIFQHAMEMSPLWKKACPNIHIVCNRGESELDWPGEIHEFPEAVGKNTGWSALRKLHHSVKLAATFSGCTALLEYDALLLPGWETLALNKILLGSTSYSVDRKYGMAGIGRSFALCPWVTTQAGWIQIRDTMNNWQTARGRYLVHEDKYTDRFLTLAAQVAGLAVLSAGFGICSIDSREEKYVVEAMQSGGKLFHGFKTTDVVPIDFF